MEILGLRKKIEQLINEFSAENGSNTPDFILAEYLMNCLKSFDLAVNQREKWYNRPGVCNCWASDNGHRNIEHVPECFAYVGDGK